MHREFVADGNGHLGGSALDLAGTYQMKKRCMASEGYVLQQSAAVTEFIIFW